MASITKRCDCDGWNKCLHSWIVRYRTEGGRSGRQRERSFGSDLGEAEDFVLKVAHDRKARVFIDPEAGKAVFRAEAEGWLSAASCWTGPVLRHLLAPGSVVTVRARAPCRLTDPKG